MKICVYGAGAIGGYLAARMARAGQDVSVIARGPHLEAIRSQGLTLETPAEKFTVHPRASEKAEEIGIQDLVVITAKTPALPQIARSLHPLLGPDTPVAFAVNGIFWFYGDGFAPAGRKLPTDRLDPECFLHRLVGTQRSLGMVIYSPNEVVAPGIVRNGREHGNRFVLGEALSERGQQRPAALAAALAGCGFDIEATPAIRREMWNKLVRNVSGSPLCALTGADGKTAFSEPGIRRLAAELLREALAVAAAHGFDDLGIEPEAQFATRGQLAHKPSMLQDLERGRPVEIDTMLGAVADFAGDAGIATPTLDAILALLTTRARVAGCYPPA
jgi:2-dehydropantoate 2-reductase